MIWEEMTYNRLQQSSSEFETEPEELFEYYKKNTKKTHEENSDTVEFVLK